MRRFTLDLGNVFSSTPLAILQPRTAIAWQFEPKTVLRAGFGLFSDILPGSIADVVGVNPPYVKTFQGGSAWNCRRNGHCAGSSEQRGRRDGSGESDLYCRISARATVLCFFAGEFGDVPSTGGNYGGAGWGTSRAVFYGVEFWAGASVGSDGKSSRAVRGHAGGESALSDAGEWVSDGLRRLLRAISVCTAHRSTIWSGDAICDRRKQPLPRVADDRREAFWKRVDRTSELHVEPLHGYGFERRISAVFRRRNSFAASGGLGARLRPLRLRHPSQSERAICLCAAIEGAKAEFGARAERLASVGNLVLA